MGQSLLVIGFIIFGVIAAWIGSIGAKKRREALDALAQRHNLRFSPARDRSHDDEYAHFEIFRRGHSRAAYNTLWGEIPALETALPAKMGDFIYKTTQGSGKNRRTVTHRFSYLIVDLPFERMPDLLIRPEGVFDKLASAFGADDIDFESAEFSRRFYVKCPDRKFAYDICHPRMIEFLLGTDPVAIDIEYARLCLADGRRGWSPEQFEWAIGWVDQFLAQWPDFVLKDLRTARR